MSTTALAEYADMLFTRAHLVLRRRNWWLELHPTSLNVDPTARVMLRAEIRNPHAENGWTSLSQNCPMHAAEVNALVGLDVLDTVIDAHLAKFMDRVRAAENGILVVDEDE